MSKTELICEDFIREIIQDEIDYTIEDQGIGYYEYGNGKYVDVDMQMTLVKGYIEIYYSAEPESVIFTEVLGTMRGYDQNERDYECDYVAELTEVSWEDKYRAFKAIYGVRQN